MAPERNKADDIIPPQQVGAKTDNEYALTADTVDEARTLFIKAKNRLTDINHWHEYCEGMTATFQLMDHNGNAVDRDARVDDHFKIDIPGPGPGSGDGYDWVQIEAIEDKSNSNAEIESFAIRVRPAENPDGGGDTSHFFKDYASSSFKVQREGRKVIAGVHGRNEIPNTDADSLLDKARNAMVALGAMAGFSDIQWKNLSKGIIEGKA